MRALLAGLIVVHGLLHFLGVARAFGLAELPQLSQPISRAQGALWLLAGVSLLATAVLLVRAPRSWWMAGFVAVLLSQAAIFTSWQDAKWGTVANVLVLLAVAYGFASEGPFGLRAEYRRLVGTHTPAPEARGEVTDEDLQALPEPLRRYLRVSGAVGQPVPRRVRARWRGRIRGGPGEPWMTFTAQQHNVLDEPARYFLMDAPRGFLPVDVLHVFRNEKATMRVRLLSAIPIVRAEGPEMTRAETVTLFNDLCLLAPGALIDAAVEWEAVDDGSVRGSYTLGPNTVSAVLSFNEDGELVNFVSDDRLAMSADGTEFTPQRWSTPVGEYRRFGTHRIMTRGEGLWEPPGGEAYSYFEAQLLEHEVVE